MRLLRSDTDLGDIPMPLRQELADCLERWRTSGVPYGPDDDLILLVEPGDTVDAVASYLGGEAGAHDDDFIPPAEWVTDRGCAYETFICLGDDGNGLSVFTPQTEGIDPILLQLCAAYVSQQSALT